VEEELGELREAIQKEDSQATKEELGDLLFSIVNFARQEGLQSEDALQSTNAKFIDRFEFVERRIADSGGRLGDVDLEQMDRYWEEAKTSKKN